MARRTPTFEVSWQGRVYATLVEPVATDMFWVTWRILPRSEPGSEIVWTPEFWEPSADLEFRDRHWRLAPFAFSAAGTRHSPPSPDAPFISMRALNVPTPWSRLLALLERIPHPIWVAAAVIAGFIAGLLRAS